MITPSFGLTATERVLPRLALNWTTGLAQTGVDVVRAGDASYIDSDGLLKIASADTQRIDWSTGVAGLLIEESRRNELLYSNTFDNAAWATLVGGTGSAPVVTPNAGISPDGTNNAYRLQANRGAGNTAADFSAITNVPAVAYTNPHNSSVSIWAKSNTGANQTVYFRNQTGAGGSVITVTPTWQRFSFSGSVAATSDNMQIGSRGTVNTTNSVDILIYNGQLEIAAFPTSDIFNEGTRVTRNADVATMTGTNFSDWFNASEGTFVAWYNTFNPGANAAIVQASDNTNNERIEQYVQSATNRAICVNGGVTQALINSGAISGNVNNRHAFAYKVDSFAASLNGGAVGTDTSGSVPSGIDRLLLGRRSVGTPLINGHIQKVMYFPQRLTNAEVQAFSK